MTKKIKKKIFLYILILISTVLILAYMIEYKFNYEPCKLCIYERIPYFLSIFLLIKILFINSYEKITLLILALVFISSSILGFYHFGIEQGFFSESLACTNINISENLSKDEIIEQLKQNTVSCKNISFKIMGLSLAAINTIFSICLSVIFIKILINYGKNQ